METPEASTTCDAYRAANFLRMAARRTLEWVGMFWKVWLDFRYEISDLSSYGNTGASA